MSIEKAKEFLVELAENDEAASKVDAAYLAALRQVADELGYELSDEDLSTALVEVTSLGDADVAEVSGYAIYRDSLFWMKSPAPGGAGRLFGSPLGFQTRTFGS